MKYIIELKEPLWRRWLRRGLWGLFSLLILLACWTGVAGALRIISGIQLKQSTGLISAISPEMGILLAERFYQKNPSTESALVYAKAAMEAKAWELALALLEKIRAQLPADSTSAAYKLIAEHHTAPESAPNSAFLLSKLSPQNEEEIIIVARAALLSANKGLLSTIKRPLGTLAKSKLADRAGLLRAQLSLADGDTEEAKERAKSLVDKELPARDAVELLALLERLGLPEAKDYRSALRLRSRSERLLTLELCDYLWDRESPAEILGWLENLPTPIARITEVQLRRIALLRQSHQPKKAAEATQELDSVALAEAVKSAMEGHIPGLGNVALEKELVGILRFGQLTNNPELELAAANELSRRFGESAWAANSVLASALKTQKSKNIAEAYEELSLRLPDAALPRARAVYWRQLTSPTSELTVYEQLKQDYLAYPDDAQIKLSLAATHLRLGNTTDALLALGETPKTNRAMFFRAYLLTKAGQLEKAFKLFQAVEEKDLTDVERELLVACRRQIEESSTAMKWLELLKPAPTPDKAVSLPDSAPKDSEPIEPLLPPMPEPKNTVPVAQ